MPREYLEEESIKFFYKIVCVCVCMCSIVPDSATPWTVALQAPLSVGFSRQVYWSGLPFPTSGHLPDPGIEPSSLVSPVMAGGFFTTEPPRSDSILGLAGHRVSVGLPQVAQGDAGLIPGSGRSPRGGCGNTLQYFCLENPKHRGA